MTALKHCKYKNCKENYCGIHKEVKIKYLQTQSCRQPTQQRTYQALELAAESYRRRASSDHVLPDTPATA